MLEPVRLCLVLTFFIQAVVSDRPTTQKTVTPSSNASKCQYYPPAVASFSVKIRRSQTGNPILLSVSLAACKNIHRQCPNVINQAVVDWRENTEEDGTTDCSCYEGSLNYQWERIDGGPVGNNNGDWASAPACKSSIEDVCEEYAKDVL